MIQLVQLIEAFSPFWIECSAVATMVPSRELISRASATTEKIATRCGAGAWVTSGAAVTAAGPSIRRNYGCQGRVLRMSAGRRGGAWPAARVCRQILV